MRRLRCEELQRIDVRKIDFRLGTYWQYPPPDSIAVSIVEGDVHVIHQMADFYISIERTACNYGGSRPWFLCPQCHDRRAVLYHDGYAVIACRRCMGLSYASDTLDTFDRLVRKARKLEAKSGGADGRPKWMRIETFERLRHEAVMARWNAIRWLGRKH